MSTQTCFDTTKAATKAQIKKSLAAWNSSKVSSAILGKKHKGSASFLTKHHREYLDNSNISAILASLDSDSGDVTSLIELAKRCVCPNIAALAALVCHVITDVVQVAITPKSEKKIDSMQTQIDLCYMLRDFITKVMNGDILFHRALFASMHAVFSLQEEMKGKKKPLHKRMGGAGKAPLLGFHLGLCHAFVKYGNVHNPKALTTPLGLFKKNDDDIMPNMIGRRLWSFLLGDCEFEWVESVPSKVSVSSPSKGGEETYEEVEDSVPVVGVDDESIAPITVDDDETPPQEEEIDSIDALERKLDAARAAREHKKEILAQEVVEKKIQDAAKKQKQAPAPETKSEVGDDPLDLLAGQVCDNADMLGELKASHASLFTKYEKLVVDYSHLVARLDTLERSCARGGLLRSPGETNVSTRKRHRAAYERPTKKSKLT